MPQAQHATIHLRYATANPMLALSRREQTVSCVTERIHDLSADREELGAVVFVDPAFKLLEDELSCRRHETQLAETHHASSDDALLVNRAQLHLARRLGGRHERVLSCEARSRDRVQTSTLLHQCRYARLLKLRRCTLALRLHPLSLQDDSSS